MPGQEEHRQHTRDGAWQDVLLDTMRDLRSEVRDLRDETSALDNKLRDHMDKEEEGMKTISLNLQQITQQHSEVSRAFPMGDDGKPRYHEHRVYHDDKDETSGLFKKLKGGFFEKAGQILALIAVYYIFSGKAEHFIMELAK
jgi:hypothetical protein